MRRNVFWKNCVAVVDKPKGGQTKGNAASPRLMGWLAHPRGPSRRSAGTPVYVTMLYLHLSPESADQAVDMLTRSREQGGIAVSGHGPVGPRESKMTNARNLRAFRVEAPGIEFGQACRALR